MCTRRISFIAIIAPFVIAAAAVVMGADLPQASFSPDRILKGTTPTITITLDKGIPNEDKITGVRVGGKVEKVQRQEAGGKLSVTLPKLDFVGKADVEVIGEDDKPVAIGQLNYVESVERSSNGPWLLLLYVLLIVLPPTGMTLYDIYLSYKERSTVLDNLKDNKPNIDEMKALLVTMDQGPSGLTGLTRGLIAVTLILILAVAVFHLVVFAPTDLPKIAEQLLTLLAGTLTAITGFYFGSKAATAATQSTESIARKTGGSAVPKIMELKPRGEVAANSKLKVIGEGFGKEQGKGTVKFNDQEGTVDDWADGLITVTVPGGLPSGDINVIVTNDNGKSSDPQKIRIKQ